jgi:hypothetical protein
MTLAILPPPENPPLTVAEALRNIAREAMERRRARGIADDTHGPEDLLVLSSAENHPDRSGASPVLHPFDEAEQHWSEVGIAGQQEALLV